MIDKKKIKRSFTTHACSYDGTAHLQRKVADEVVEWIRGLEIHPDQILDVGTGTGSLALMLKSLFPSATVQACDIAYGMVQVAKKKGEYHRARCLDFTTADAECLPYRSEKFDLVVSSLTYQWLSEWGEAFQEVLRVLKKKGVLVFSTLGGDTLFELRDAYAHACHALGNSHPAHLHHFIRRDTLQHLLSARGFVKVSVASRWEKEYYENVRQLLINLKTIGAQNASPDTPPGLGKPRVFRTMVNTYEGEYGEGRGIPATYEVLFGYGEK